MTFYGVSAPAWADDSRVVEILREEANDERDWFGTDRDKALLLHVADRLVALNEKADALEAGLVAEQEHVESCYAVITGLHDQYQAEIRALQEENVNLMNQAPDAGAERLHFKVGPFTVEPGQNNIANRGAQAQQPPVDGWVVGIRPNLEFANGKTPGVDVIHLHHAVWLNLSASDPTSPSLPQRFFAVGEEKTNLKFPPGYGYAYKATDHWLLDYMIHNLTSNRDKVWISYDIDFIPATSAAAKDIVPVRPIWMDVQNGETYPVFDVPRGGGEKGEYTDPLP